MSKDTGGSAFPGLDSNPNTGTLYCFSSGMTLRDCFAAHALSECMNRFTFFDGESPSQIAVNAYRIADAMLAERAKDGAE